MTSAEIAARERASGSTICTVRRRSPLLTGWPADLSDDEVLSRLLALNLARGAGPVGRGNRVKDQYHRAAE